MRGDRLGQMRALRGRGLAAASLIVGVVLALLLATVPFWSWTSSVPDARAQETTAQVTVAPSLAGTPEVVGTPLPTDPSLTGSAGASSGEGGDAAASGEEVSAVDDAGNAERRGKDRAKDKEERERKAREERGSHRSVGNGGVSEVVAAPMGYAMPEALRQLPITLYQQDASDAMAGSVGESGTINGRPREAPDPVPEAPVGPGNPGEILLPPPVPGLPTSGTEAGAPILNPAASQGISGTTELVFSAVADTTVFTTAPGSPQTPESINFLAIGGPQGAISLISFEVYGVGNGTVLGARLTFYGAGEAGAPGGSVGVIYDYVAFDGLTANGVPRSETAYNVHGAPAWFERVEPSGMTAVDVTGSVYGDGNITFVLPGQAEATGSLYSLESGSPPQLILTVALPA